jgi:phage terminase small subunit
MARGGYRPGAGRPRKGEKRSEKVPVQKANEEQADVPVNPTEDRTPLEFMLAVMNDTQQPPNRRDRMAIAAAPFMHPRAGEAGKKEEQAERAKRAGAGKFAPSAPPRAATVN